MILCKKCGIGSKTDNANITIGKIKKKGYSNIIYIGNETDEDSEED